MIEVDMLVSVLVMTYNQENTIQKTLTSIFQQKTSFSFEVIIADDCSTDHTRDVIDRLCYVAPVKVVKLYNKYNMGLIKNYFNALTECTGDIIMGCAGDDYWLEKKIQIQVDYLIKNPNVGMCYGKAQLCNEEGNLLNRYIGYNCSEFSKLFLHNGVPAVTSAFRKRLVNKYIEEVNPISRDWPMEDYPMWLWFAKKSKISFINETLAVYRYVGESLSHSSKISKRLRFEEYVYDMQKTMCTNLSVPIKEAEISHYDRLALLHREYGDLKKYRNYKLKTGKFIDVIKALISFAYCFR